jgi:hypothetical protein
LGKGADCYLAKDLKEIIYSAPGVVFDLSHRLDLREKRLIEALRCRSKARAAESLIEALVEKIVDAISWFKIRITSGKWLCQGARVVSFVDLQTCLWHAEEEAKGDDDNRHGAGETWMFHHFLDGLTILNDERS